MGQAGAGLEEEGPNPRVCLGVGFGPSSPLGQLLKGGGASGGGSEVGTAFDVSPSGAKNCMQCSCLFLEQVLACFHQILQGLLLTLHSLFSPWWRDVTCQPRTFQLEMCAVGMCSQCQAMMTLPPNLKSPFAN